MAKRIALFNYKGGVGKTTTFRDGKARHRKETWFLNILRLKKIGFLY